MGQNFSPGIKSFEKVSSLQALWVRRLPFLGHMIVSYVIPPGTKLWRLRPAPWSYCGDVCDLTEWTTSSTVSPQQTTDEGRGRLGFNFLSLRFLLSFRGEAGNCCLVTWYANEEEREKKKKEAKRENRSSDQRNILRGRREMRKDRGEYFFFFIIYVDKWSENMDRDTWY